MIVRIREEFGVSKWDVYVPRLQVDILVGIMTGGSELRFLLFEVKLGKPLNLANYSQLLGYMHVASFISTGLPFLVSEKHAGVVSADFAKEISTGTVDMTYQIANSQRDFCNSYSTGIGKYFIGSDVELFDSSAANGLSSWKGLAEWVMNCESIQIAT